MWDDLLRVAASVQGGHATAALVVDFFAHANEAGRRQIDSFLSAPGITGGPGWLVDMLALIRLRMQNPPSPSNPPPAPNALTSEIAPHRRQSAEETP